MGMQQTLPYLLGASAVIPNLLSGTPLEWWAKAGAITLYGSANTGPDTVSLAYYLGAEPGAVLIPAGSALPVASTAFAVKTNENFLGQFAIPAGARLVLGIAGANTHAGQIQIIAG